MDPAAVLKRDLHSRRGVSDLERHVVEQVGALAEHPAKPERLMGTPLPWACNCGCSLAIRRSASAACAAV
ncbi:MAG: hypothetical protein MUF25_18910, partial [Pirellulaceae bacterium]|nr:hypothetical protein [Pirellulaceae bacterium]